MTVTAPVSSDVAATLSTLLGAKAAAVEQIYGGRNSRVYRFHADGRSLVAKLYFRQAGDARDRFAAETAALRFLDENGSHFAARLIAADAGLACAILEDLGGRKLSGPEVRPAHIDQAIDFACALRALRGKPGAAAFGPASEAHFSLSGTETHLRARVSKLRAVRDAALSSFLEEELAPAVEAALAWASARIDFSAELPLAERTLSQSDFGFHNALLADDGRLRFVDFEYFGWDDPAKMICDFLLQPVDGLPPAARARFEEGVVTRFSQEGLAERVEASYPLFGLKWALIMLNGFLPEHNKRRGFAKAPEEPAAQIAKSRRMLSRMLAEHGEFKS